MAEQIKDGTGVGYHAQVDSFNRLRVFSTNTNQEHHAAQLGVGYFPSTVTAGNTSLTVGAGEGGYIMYLQNNDGAKSANIQKIIFSTDVAGGFVTFVRAPVLGTVSANTSIAAVNMNMGSAGVAPITTHIWDETGTTGIGGITGGTEMVSFIVGNGITFFPPDGAFIMPPGTTFGIKYTAPAGSATEITMGVRIFLEG